MLSVGLEDEERQRSDASTKGIEKKVDDVRKAPATTGANKSTGNRRAATGRRYMTIFCFCAALCYFAAVFRW